MSQPDTPSTEPASTTPRPVSLLAIALSVPYLFLAILMFMAADVLAAKANFRHGLHATMGAPDQEFNQQYASTMLFGIPAILLIVRAFTNPKASQSLAIATGGLPASIIITSCCFGRTDMCSMALFGAMAVGMLAYGFQPRSRIESAL